MPCFSSALVIMPHDALRYCSRYFGKSVANELSSLRVPPRLCSGLKASSFHLSISSVSQGLSFLYVDGISAEIAVLEWIRGCLNVNGVRVLWCFCDREEDKLQGLTKIIRTSSKESRRRYAAAAPPITSKRAFARAITCGELLLATTMQRVLAAAASSLVYTTANSTTHADMANRPRTFLDIDIDGEPAGRLVFELFTDETPRTCEKYGIKWHQHGNAGMLTGAI